MSVTPGPQEAAELLQRIALNLDLCPLGRAGSTFSFPSTPPSCRSRYLYWIYDDPSTPLFAPDKLYLYGGLQTSSVQDLGTPRETHGESFVITRRLPTTLPICPTASKTSFPAHAR